VESRNIGKSWHKRETFGEFWQSVVRIVDDNDFLSSDKFLGLAQSSDPISYFKGDLIFRGGLWRGQEVGRASRSAVFDRLVLIGHSDRAIGRVMVSYFKSLGARHVAAINLCRESESSSHLPLGLTNDCDDGPLHRVLGDTELFRRAYERVDPSNSRQPWLYVNFNSATAPKYRRRLLLEAKKHIDFALVRNPEYSIEGRLKFLTELGLAQFVACPRGNGFDTHRVWESLYMGAIPVVLDTPQARELYFGLPIIFVQRWSHAFDKSRMTIALDDLKASRFDSRRLRASCWERHILDLVHG
jgi:hypothetical protein